MKSLDLPPVYVPEFRLAFTKLFLPFLLSLPFLILLCTLLRILNSLLKRFHLIDILHPVQLPSFKPKRL